MEHLTKQQLVLLALLVSFVTSIATGIVTVALMDQAPEPILQTINRVVERTIERVVQTPTENQSAATTIVTKETVVLKADDMVVEAVEKSKRSNVKIFSENGRNILASGVVLRKDGFIAAPLSVFDNLEIFKNATTTDSVVLNTFPAIDGLGNELSLSPRGIMGENFVLLKASPKDEGGTLHLEAAVMGDSSRLKLGQAVVAIGGESDTEVRTGIISAVLFKSRDDGLKTAYLVETDTEDLKKILPGATILNLSGEIVGIRLKNEASGSYSPVNFLSLELTDI